MLFQITEPKAPCEQKPKTQKKAIGIDLGTTHSVIACVENGHPKVITLCNGQSLLPSVVAYYRGQSFVGEEAQAFLHNEPQNVVHSVKRLMGRGVQDLVKIQGITPYEIVSQEETSIIRLNLDNTSKTPIEISAEILKSLKEQAEQVLREKIEQAVITVPAYFDDAQRMATKDAARLAGLEVLRLLNEPTAAALAYGLENEKEGIYAIYDLGGGTFDISLLKLEKGIFQVLATGGDSALGGDDIDHLIVEFILKEKKEQDYDRTQIKQLLLKARKLKESLSVQTEAEIDLKGELNVFTRAQLNQLVEPLIDRTIMLFRSVLQDAGLSSSDLEGIVLVGGSTRIPLIAEKLEIAFYKKPLNHINPDEIVALGAALQAHSLTNGSDTLLLDVIPLSLGIETMGGIVEKIIERNTPIPIAKAQEFTTYLDGQQGMVLHVVQGEREMAKDCRSLAHFELKNIPPLPAGVPRILVTFTVDADGLLTVTALEEKTGQSQMVEVKPSYGLTENEVIEMLKESLLHGAKDLEERFLIETKIEGQSVLNALKAAIEKDGDLLTIDEKNAIVASRDDLQNKLKEPDREAIKEAIHVLEEQAKPFIEKRLNRALGDSLKGTKIHDY